MSIWGKIADAAADLSMRSPIGTLLGGAGAHEGKPPQDHRADNEVPFTVGVIVLSAKMAKADRIITKDEIKAFKEAFQVSDAEMKHAAGVFNIAKQDTSGYEICAEQLVTTFKGNRRLLEDVLEGLFHIAKADDALHPDEEQFLAKVADRFGFTNAEFNSMKARHVVAAQRNPYDVLGIKPSASDAELESHYRKLVADNQPDKLTARGVPEEFVVISNEKIAAITAAYEAIVKERGR
jgi:DnaJ like chaperone protein